MCCGATPTVDCCGHIQHIYNADQRDAQADEGYHDMHDRSNHYKALYCLPPMKQQQQHLHDHDHKNEYNEDESNNKISSPIINVDKLHKASLTKSKTSTSSTYTNHNSNKQPTTTNKK
jgi:hypothetical protein